MAWISKNAALSVQEMENNAQELWNFFSARGFTKNAVAAMCGNMWRESNINPGVWQNFKINYQMGYGLVQWTPATKVISFLRSGGYAIDSGEGQCQRILWEYVNKQQYYPTKSYPLTFTHFAHSTADVEYLTKAFFFNYERGNEKKAAMPDRIKWAKYFFAFLDGEAGEPP